MQRESSRIDWMHSDIKKQRTERIKMKNLKQAAEICFLTFVICLLLQAGPASGDEARCLFSKGGYLTGSVSIQGSNVQLAAAEENKSLPLSDMIFIKYPAPYNATVIEEGVVLVNGNFLSGEVDILENRSVQLTSGLLGKQIIKAEYVAQVILTAQRIFEVRKNFDQPESLLLRNGDRMPGAIKWISEKTVAIEAVIGLIDVPRQNIAAMNFKAVDRKAESGPYRIKFKNGDQLTGTISSLSDSAAVLKHPVFGRLSINTAFIKEIRALSISADHLSLAGETEVKTTPYFDSIRNIRKDRSYTDEYLGIDGEGYDRGIIAMSRTSLSYSLGNKYRAFYAELGIDESVGPKGSVTFTIKVDGENRYESRETVTGAMDPIPVLISLENAEKLEITIDFAEGGSVADFAVLGDTLLIKQ